MNLYNAIFGINRFALLWLTLLDLTEEQCGRFRDCFLMRHNDELRICVFARIGGFNRAAHEREFRELALHPNYLRDYDDEFDNTYALIEFAIPQCYQSFAASLVAEFNADLLPELPGKRFKELLRRLELGPGHGHDDDPEVIRAIKVMSPVLAQVANNMAR